VAAQVPRRAPTRWRALAGCTRRAQGRRGGAEALLAAGADVNQRGAHGRTPLHVATFARQREAVRVLAEAGPTWACWRTTATTP
jgi:ankyrin repeat protein